MNKSMLALLVLLCLLTGCVMDKAVVTQTTTQYATLDDTWISDCPVVAPPDPVTQASLDLQHQLDEWAKVYGQQVAENIKCNIRYKTAREYNAKKKLETTTAVCTDGICK